MSPELGSKVLGATGKSRNLCDIRDPINQDHAFFFVS